MAKMVFCIYQHYIAQLAWMKQELEAQGHEVILVPPSTDLTPYMKDTDIFSLGWEFIDGKFMDKCPRLIHLNTFAVAYNHLDIVAAAERGITCSNTPGANKVSTAEIAVSLMLAAARFSATSHKNLQQGIWWQNTGVNLRGKTVGIIGTGNIGTEVAHILHHGFQMKVIANDIAPSEALKKECGVEYMSVDDVVSQADFITMHVPVMPETTHMIDERRFRMMKKTAIFVNASRGAIIVESDLEKALKEGWIFAAGMDVYNTEPTQDFWFNKYNNIATYAHLGGLSMESIRNMGQMCIESMTAAARGEVPPYLLNPDALKHRKKV